MCSSWMTWLRVLAIDFRLPAASALVFFFPLSSLLSGSYFRVLFIGQCRLPDLAGCSFALNVTRRRLQTLQALQLSFLHCARNLFNVEYRLQLLHQEPILLSDGVAERRVFQGIDRTPREQRV
jgi:hypothetical protein